MINNAIDGFGPLRDVIARALAAGVDPRAAIIQARQASVEAQGGLPNAPGEVTRTDPREAANIGVAQTPTELAGPGERAPTHRQEQLERYVVAVTQRMINAGKSREELDDYMRRLGRQPISDTLWGQIELGRQGRGPLPNVGPSLAAQNGQFEENPEETAHRQLDEARGMPQGRRTNEILDNPVGAAVLGRFDPLGLPGLVSEEYRRGRSEIARRHPVANFVGELVGGARLPFPANTGASNVIPRQAVAGGLYSGAYGFNTSEGDFEDRLYSGLLTMPIGAAVPPLFHGIAQGGGAALRAIRGGENPHIDAQIEAIRNPSPEPSARPPEALREFAENRAIADYATENNLDHIEVGRNHIQGTNAEMSSDINARTDRLMREMMDQPVPPEARTPYPQPRPGSGVRHDPLTKDIPLGVEDELPSAGLDRTASNRSNGFRRAGSVTAEDYGYDSADYKNPNMRIAENPDTGEAVSLLSLADGRYTFEYHDSVQGDHIMGIWDPKTNKIVWEPTRELTSELARHISIIRTQVESAVRDAHASMPDTHIVDVIPGTNGTPPFFNTSRLSNSSTLDFSKMSDRALVNLFESIEKTKPGPARDSYLKIIEAEFGRRLRDNPDSVMNERVEPPAPRINFDDISPYDDINLEGNSGDGAGQAPPVEPPSGGNGGTPPPPPEPPAPPSEPDPVPRRAGNINTDRLGIDAETRNLIRIHADQYETDPQTRAAMIDRAEALIAEHGDDLYAVNPELNDLPAYSIAVRAAHIKARTEQVELSRRVLDPESNSATAASDFIEKTLLAAALQDRVMDVAGVAGRLLNAHRIRIGRGGIPDRMPEMPGGVLGNPQNLVKFAEEVANAADPNIINILNRDVLRPKASDYLFSYWYNWRLLSSVYTHIRNFLGNTGNILWDISADHGLASILGQTRRFSQNADRVMGREVVMRMFGALAGMRSALQRDVKIPGRENLRSRVGAAWELGTPLDFVNRTERPTVFEGRGKKQFLEAPTRAISSMDEFFRNVAASSNMWGRAWRQAYNEARVLKKTDTPMSNADIMERAHEIVKDPPNEFLTDTAEYARRMRFQDEAGPLAQALERYRTAKTGDSPGRRGMRHLLRLVVPFLATPSSLLRTALRRSPVGLLEQRSWEDFKAGGARRQLALGRVAAGSAFLTYVYDQAVQGNITGKGPADPRRRAELEATGWRANRINGVPYDGLEPFSNLMGVIATTVERAQEPGFSAKSFLDQAGTMVLTTGEALMDSSWTENLANVMEAFRSSEQEDRANAMGASFISNIVSPVPGFVRDITRATDPVERDTTGDGSVGDRITGRIMGEIPGLSDNLPEKVDIYGRTRERGRTPFSASSQDNDPVVNEIERLSRESGVRSPLVGPPRTTFGTGPNKQRLTAEERTRYTQLSGYYILEYMREFMDSEEWANMDDDERREEIKDVATEARAQARDELFPGLSPDDTDEDGTPQQ